MHGLEPAPSDARRRDLLGHLAGAAISRLAPPLLQLALLLIVSRGGTLDDVGLLALASSIAFLCGALGELGFANSLSVPRVAFGTDAPPLRPTARLRLGGAVAASAFYAILWLAGLGDHHAVLLLVTPLPFALALAHGYAGAMNASGRLKLEGRVSIVESAAALITALLGTLLMDALPSALVALTVTRLLGTAARALLLRTVPQTHSLAGRRVGRSQLWFALATVGFVTQGQAEMVAIGLAGSLALAAVYGPAIRTAGSVVLGGEALTYALYGGAHPDERAQTGWMHRRWREVLLGTSVLAAIVFTLLAEPFLEWLLDEQLHDLRPLVLLLALVIVLKFGVLVLTVDIVRAARQRELVPLLAAASLALVIGAAVAAAADSVTGVAAARLASEGVLAAGLAMLVRRG